jgi:excinuclease ABC subunit C
MHQLAQLQQYEAAAQVKLHLDALDYLQLQPVSPEEYLVNPNLLEDTRQEAITSLIQALQPAYPHITSLHQIEMFDVAHLFGTAATAAMTVALNGVIDSRNFRHFKIKFAATTSDVDMLREVLTRRLNNPDWPRPDLIVLDGGKPQLTILKSLVVNHKSLPPVIALSKQFETLVIPVGDSYSEINLPKSHPGLLLLLHLRDEAHRFSRRLHHIQRAKIITDAEVAA